MSALSCRPRAVDAVRPAAKSPLAVVGLAVCVLATGCLDTDGDGSTSPAEPVAASVPEALVDQTWQVRMSADAVRAPFEQNPAWASLFMRKHPEALAGFAQSPVEGRGQARVHADYASLYRQAALMGANATRHVYGTDRQPEDPPTVDYMVGVSSALVRDCEAARASFAKVSADKGPKPLGDALAFWTKAAAAEDCAAALTLAAAPPLPGVPTAPPGATAPTIDGLPHWRFDTGAADGGTIEMGELASLVVLADFHEQAALAAAPEAERSLVHALVAPWDLPGAPARELALPESVDDAWLFGGFAPAAGDLVFLAAVRSEGPAAVAAHASTSVLAASLAPAVSDGAVDVEAVIDQAAGLRRQLEARMLAVSGSNQGFHRAFADLGEAAVLRAGMFVADAADQYRDAGVLRVNALERATGPGADPVFFLSTAAWDAGNRSPLRAQDIVHSHLSRFPAIAAARYPLDALHIRLGRNSAPATPLH